jgi:polysaccharide biosynthesis/export protein
VNFIRCAVSVLLSTAMFANLACAAAQSEVAAPAAPAAEAIPPMPASSADYLIGPGDTLQIFVWQNPELSVSVPVRPDGRISTPLVPDIVAVGKTPVALAADLQTALAEYVRTPQVSVIVSNPVGSLGQVKVIGQVKNPGGVAYREGLRVLDVVLQVGGISQFAAPNRAKLIRTENGKQTETRIRLGDLLEGGDLEQNLVLKPGDVVVVPQSMF